MGTREFGATGLIPCATVLLTTAAGGRRDASTATAVFVAEEPPLVSVSVASHHLSCELIEDSREFVINLAASDQAGLAGKLGSTHGDQMDKFAEFGLQTQPGEQVAAPRIGGTYASLECRVIGSHPAGPFTVFTGEVVAHTMDESKAPLLWHRGRYVSLSKDA